MTALTSAQVKGKIKYVARINNADARLLMRIYMMGRFLARLAESPYKDNFIIKGGILITSMVGVAMRSTMDIDTSIRNMNLNTEDALEIVTAIAEIQLDDDVSFEVKRVSKIMDDLEYPGIRLEMNAKMDEMITPIKMDISTGDIITPGAIEYSYPLLIEDRKIILLAYNTETILAEKLQTILARDIFNTRMRDYYDIYTILWAFNDSIDNQVLKEAFTATSKKRKTEFDNIEAQLRHLAENEALQKLWARYRLKYPYAAGISFECVMESVRVLAERACIIE